MKQFPLSEIRLIAFIFLFLATDPAISDSRADDEAKSPPVQKYQLIEEWSVDAQGPVHLRQKEVKATYQLDVKELGLDAESRRQLQVHVSQVAVKADISAQQRKGSYDSANPPKSLSIDDHELIRPMALLGQTFVLKYDKQGVLKQVEGTEPAVRKLGELYDDHLRGSEQDLHTREFERERLSGSELIRAWADVFISPLAETDATETTGELHCTACIPSESWMRRVALPVAETIETRMNADGTATIEKTARLKDAKAVETSIGETNWKYTPSKAEKTTNVKRTSNGRVEEMSSVTTVELSTVLSLGNDIPIQMSIRHTTKLSKR